MSVAVLTALRDVLISDTTLADYWQAHYQKDAMHFVGYNKAPGINALPAISYINVRSILEQGFDDKFLISLVIQINEPEITGHVFNGVTRLSEIERLIVDLLKQYPYVGTPAWIEGPITVKSDLQVNHPFHEIEIQFTLHTLRSTGASIPADPAPAPAPVFTIPAGLYANGGKTGVSQTVVDHPAIDGILIMNDWAAIEEVEGVYNWTDLDAKISQAATAGKKARLALHIGGDEVPAWIVDQLDVNGGSIVSIQATKNAITSDIPAFWDAIYLTEKKRFYTTLAARYGNNETVTCFSVSFVDPFTGDWGILGVDNQSMADAGYNSDVFANAWYALVKSVMLDAPTKTIASSIGTIPQSLLNLIGSSESQSYALETFLGLLRDDTVIDIKQFAGGKGSLHAQTPDPDLTSTLLEWQTMHDLINVYGATGFGQPVWNVTSDPDFKMNGGQAYGGAGEPTVADVFLGAATIGTHYQLSWLEPWEIDIENTDTDLQAAITAAKALYV